MTRPRWLRWPTRATPDERDAQAVKELAERRTLEGRGGEPIDLDSDETRRDLTALGYADVVRRLG